MPKTVASQTDNGCLDYDGTLVLAIELSVKNWVLAAQVPGLLRTKAKQTIEPTAEALMVAIDGYRAHAAAAGHVVERVVTGYEAGWSGFWLAHLPWRRGECRPTLKRVSRPADATGQV